jgi:hypothetical protein
VDFLNAGIGQINQAGATDALFLKVFSGEVLTAFKLKTVMDNLVTKRSISSGKSAQFPVTGWLQASYHTPGQELKGQQGVQGEKLIVIDDLLTAPFFVANIEEAKNHYDIRSIYSGEAANALVRQYDNKAIRKYLLAARQAANLSSATVNPPAGAVIQQSLSGALAAHNIFVKLTYVTVAGETTPGVETTLAVSINNVATVVSPAPAANVIAYNVYAGATTGSEKLQNTVPIPIGLNWTESNATGITTTGRVVPTSNTAAGSNGTFAGTQLSRASVDTDATVMRTALIDALAQLDKNNVDRDGRFILLKPDQFWLMHKDVTYGYVGNQFFGGQGGIASGQLPMIGGAPIFVSNNFPTGVLSQMPGENVDYSGDFSKSVAVVAHKSAIGTLKLLELASEMEYSVRHQGTLVVSKMAVGTDILRPEASIEIKTP